MASKKFRAARLADSAAPSSVPPTDPPPPAAARTITGETRARVSVRHADELQELILDILRTISAAIGREQKRRTLQNQLEDVNIWQEEPERPGCVILAKDHSKSVSFSFSA